MNAFVVEMAPEEGDDMSHLFNDAQVEQTEQIELTRPASMKEPGIPVPFEHHTKGATLFLPMGKHLSSTSCSMKHSTSVVPAQYTKEEPGFSWTCVSRLGQRGSVDHA